MLSSKPQEFFRNLLAQLILVEGSALDDRAHVRALILEQPNIVERAAIDDQQVGANAAHLARSRHNAASRELSARYPAG